MHSIPLPKRSAKSVYETCVRGVSGPALQARLLGASAAIEGADQLYQMEAARCRYDLVAKDQTPAGVTRELMIRLYDDHLVPRRSRGRAIYEEIRAGAPHSKCPSCGQRTVSQLDHFLPKTSYPNLALTPSNLVPSCADCNKAKLNYHPTCVEDTLIHPYFDCLDGLPWLEAVVIETTPSALRFGVSHVGAADPVLVRRLEHHLRLCDLKTLYSVEAANELTGNRLSLAAHFEAGGEAALRLELERRSRSWSAHRLNGWQAVAYKAWAASDWFCAGGFAV